MRDWSSYLSSFHSEHAGITDDVLAPALDKDGGTGYDWAAAAVPPRATVLDLACGSAPMHRHLPGRRYVGLDLSFAELLLARPAPVAQADAAALPLADGAVDVVVASMALMLMPLEAALREVHRALRPGGLLVATVPSTGPLSWADRGRYARLLLALRQPGLRYPNDRALRPAAFEAAGLSLIEDEARAFSYPVATQARADLLLSSLYLPGVAPERLAAARGVVRSWVGTSIALPLRRLVARRGSGRPG